MKERDIRVRAVLRDPPDVELLARVLVELAIEQAKKEKAAQAAAGKTKKTSRRRSSSASS
jgi:hypothetical protein